MLRGHPAGARRLGRLHECPTPVRAYRRTDVEALYSLDTASLPPAENAKASNSESRKEDRRGLGQANAAVGDEYLFASGCVGVTRDRPGQDEPKVSAGETGCIH